MIPTDFSPASVMDLAWTHFYPNQVDRQQQSSVLLESVLPVAWLL